MAEELLSLKWNNHQAHFVDILNFLREKDMFVDATIACGGKIYSAHKFVLSTCSDYFKQIFTRNHSSNPIVFMKDVSCRDIEALLDFMYHGEVNVPQSSLGSLIKTAEGLQIKGLAVPDDPPSGRNQERDKRERDPSSTYLENRSPPPKRRIRERNSPPRRLSNHQSSSHTSKLFSGSSVLPPVEATLDCNDASNVPVRKSSPSSTCPNTSASNGNEKQHNSVSTASRKHSMAEEEGEEERGGDSGAEESGAGVGSGESNSEQQDSLHNTQSGPGTSGLPHSKQEEMEIKQEDVVDLGEDDDDGDWGGGGMGDGGGDESGGGGGGNDSLSSTDNTVNFSDVLLPHTEGALGAGASAGDSAMGGARGTAAGGGRLHHALGRHMSSWGGLLKPEHLGSTSDTVAAAFYAPGLPSFAAPAGVRDGGADGAQLPFYLPEYSMVGGGEGGGCRRLTPYTRCPLCDGEVSRANLQRHIRTHTGHKLYACPACAYSTGDKSNYRRHLGKRHGLQLQNHGEAAATAEEAVFGSAEEEEVVAAVEGRGRTGDRSPY